MQDFICDRLEDGQRSIDDPKAEFKDAIYTIGDDTVAEIEVVQVRNRVNTNGREDANPIE